MVYGLVDDPARTKRKEIALSRRTSRTQAFASGARHRQRIHLSAVTNSPRGEIVPKHAPRKLCLTLIVCYVRVKMNLLETREPMAQVIHSRRRRDDAKVQ